MAALTAPAAPSPRALEALRAAARPVLLAYAQILFSRSPWVGALLILSTGVAPRAAACGLLGAAAGTAAAWLLDLDPEARREGAHGYCALLLGLGLGHAFSGAAPALIVALIVAPAAALLTAALRSLLGPSGLPVLSWPFLLLYAPTMALCARLCTAAGAAVAAATAPAPLDVLLGGLGALFFLDGLAGGALLLCALLCHSRIAAVLAAGAAVVTHLACAHLLPGAPAALRLTLGYNALLTAMALGGVWFVPAASSFALALFAALLSSLLGAFAQGLLAPLGLPLAVLPFNLTVWLVLLALRTRAHDRRPKAVDFLPGTPEENLTYARTRLLRFGRLYATRLRLPVRGPWVCTQGEGGTFTHQGPWRHAFDFEVRGEGGCLFQGDGARPEQYHAYRLPVLAAAPGVVVRAVGHVPDNPVGEMNLAENWGNYVLICHGPALYSLTAHLAPGSLRVAPGQPVQAGEVIGLCGSSGRSPQPHVHFHLQASDRLGDGTLPCAFDDVVLRGAAGDEVAAALRPAEGQEVRNLTPSSDAAAQLGLQPGAEWALQAEGEEPEPVRAEVDLLGRRCLVSPRRGATLYYELGEDLFTVYDVVGDGRSALHALRAALPRLPLELDGAAPLRFRDHLPARPLRALPLRLLADLAAPFLGRDGVAVDYELSRQGRLLVVEGRSAGGEIETLAELLPGEGPQRIEVTIRGRRRVLRRPNTNGLQQTQAPAADAAPRLLREAS